MPTDTNPLKHCEDANRLLSRKPDSSFAQLAKDTVGNALGQAAFNRVTGGVPKIHVNNNVNGGIRRLVDSVNSGNKSYAGKTINQVSRVVLDVAGVNPQVVPSDPNGKSIYDSGIGAANTIGESLIVGIIDEADLPGPINDLSALAFLQQRKADVLDDISDPQCGIAAYARDLIPYAPKFNYMFMVQIQFQPDYADLGIQESNQLNTNEVIKFQYLCRQFTRPTVNVDYEEVNMYNFHTRVAKKITYEPVTLRLYDDNKNSSMVFLEKYLKARSPIARKTPSQQDVFETRGMDFSPYAAGNTQTGSAIQQLTNSSGSMGGLINENRSVLRRIDVYHVFNYGTKVNLYSFLNPKIMQFNISDFDMDDGAEPATIEMQLAYDSMFVHTDIDMSPPEFRERDRLGQRFMHRYSN